MAYLSLAPVAEAVYGVLIQDVTLASLASGGIWSDVPESPQYPFLWFEVAEDHQLGGLGSKPGQHMLPEIDLRLHVFQGDGGTMRAAETVMQRAIQVLADPPVVPGYSSWAIFHDATIPLPFELLNGVKVQELVSRFRLYVEEANQQSGFNPSAFLNSAFNTLTVN